MGNVASAVPVQWVKNAVLTAGREEGSGVHASEDATGAIDARAMAKVPRTKLGRLPRLRDLAMLTYLANLGYVDMYQDPTALAAMRIFSDAPDGFYIGHALMKHTISGDQLTAIREALSPAGKKAFDAAVSLHIGRVALPYATGEEKTTFAGELSIRHGDLEITHFGDDLAEAQGAVAAAQAAAKLTGNADVQQAAEYAAKAADAASKVASGDYAGAAADVGGKAGKMIATGTTIGATAGTLIPIPGVGTAAGAAIGAAAGAVLAVSTAIADAVNAPKYTEDDYKRMREACVKEGGKPTGGCPPDAPCGCTFPDGKTAGGYEPNWSAEDRAWWESDQSARKLQYTGLANYIAGLKEIDKMVVAADAAMRRPGATPAARAVWMQKIGDAFAKIYTSTGQDKYAKLNVAGFLADTQKRVYAPKGGRRLRPAPVQIANPAALAGALMTRGMMGATQAQTVGLMTSVAQDPEAREGASHVVKQVDASRGLFARILSWFGL